MLEQKFGNRGSVKGISRRSFLRRGVQTGVGLGLSILASQLPDNPTPENQLSSLDTIKKTELEFRDKSLTFEQAKQNSSLFARFFVKEIDGVMDLQLLVKGLYIVRLTTPQTLIEQIDKKQTSDLLSPFFVQFKHDYPDAQLSKESENLLKGINPLFNAGWVDDEGNIFVSLDYINKQGGRRDYGIPGWQFKGRNVQVQCQNPWPIVKLRTILTHEWTHKTSLTDWQPIEDDLFNRLAEQYEKSARQKPNWKKVLKQNFTLKYIYEGIDGKDHENLQNNLNEIITDYLAIRLSIDNDLPYTAAYLTPLDIVNLDAVFSQAGINLSELRQMYKYGRLRDFYLKIAKGARNINFSSEDEMLDFAIARFGPAAISIHWNQNIAKFAPPISPYFPGIETRDYDYLHGEESLAQETEDQYLPGCFLK